MYKEKIYDAQTGEEILRDFTADEVAEIEKVKAEREAEALAIAQAEALAAQKRAVILEKLGITEDEARLLLGGN